MGSPRNLFLAAALLTLPAISLADAVMDWNETGVASVLAARQPPPKRARTMAMVHVAIFNAVNAINRRYARHSFGGPTPAGASTNAAADAAPRAVRIKQIPEQRARLD